MAIYKNKTLGGQHTSIAEAFTFSHSTGLFSLLPITTPRSSGMNIFSEKMGPSKEVQVSAMLGSETDDKSTHEHYS